MGRVRRAVGERGINEEGLGRKDARSFPEPPRSRSLALTRLLFFARRCFRSLPPTESLEQAKRREVTKQI